MVVRLKNQNRNDKFAESQIISILSLVKGTICDPHMPKINELGRTLSLKLIERLLKLTNTLKNT